MKTLVLRCSGLDDLKACTSSQVILEDDALLIEEGDGAAAQMGNAYHAVMEHIEQPGEPDIDGIAARFDVGADELSMLWAMSLPLWKEIRTWLVDGACEVELSHEVDFPYHGFDRLRLRGKVDRKNVLGNRAYNVDYKSGYLEGRHHEQIYGYGFLTLMSEPDCDQVWSGILHPRHKMFDAEIIKREHAEKWFEELVWRVRNSIGTYSPGGPHCEWCKRKADCSARDRYVQMTMRDFLVGEHGRGVGNAMQDAKLVEASVRRLRALAKAECEKNGKVAIPGQARCYAMLPNQHRQLDPIKSLPILEQFLSAEEIAECTKISKTKVEEKVKSHARKGLKGEMVKRVLGALDDADALRTVVRHELRETRDDKPIGTDSAGKD